MSGKIEILDSAGVPMRSGVSRSAMAAYSAGDRHSQELASWQPRGESADSEWLGERDTVVARVHDVARNDGWASGALRTKLVGVLGPKLNLQSRPDYKALGQDHNWSVEWSRDVESKFRNFAEDPDYHTDIRQMQSMASLVQTAFLDFLQSGEALALALWEPRNGGPYSTTFQIVDPDRLSNPHNQMDKDGLKGGIERDKRGRPIAYHIRNGHPAEFGLRAKASTWSRIARKTKFGRLKVIHYFSHFRSEQTRGKTIFAPILERLKMESKRSRGELQAALLNCVLAAFIESPVDTGLMEQIFEGGEVGNYQTGRSEFHNDRSITLNGLKVPTLFPGEKFNFTSPTHPNNGFADFERAVLRNIAAGLGISYEQLSQDWSSTNYSSARASLLESWKVMVFDREMFTQNFVKPMYVLWLEEALSKGDVVLPAGGPGFYEAKAAYTRCKLLGPPRGWIDPVKEAQAAQMRMETGISTLEQECAEQGLDYEEVMDQRAREKKMLKERDLDPPMQPFYQLPPSEKDDEDEKTPSGSTEKQ